MAIVILVCHLTRNYCYISTIISVASHGGFPLHPIIYPRQERMMIVRRMVRTRYTRNSRRSTTVAMSIHSLTWFPDCLRTPSLASGSSPAARLSYMPPETHRHRPRQPSMICGEGNESIKIIKPHFTAQGVGGGVACYCKIFSCALPARHRGCKPPMSHYSCYCIENVM